MKIWTKIRLKDQDKNIDVLSSAMTNYLYKYGPIGDILKKYGVSYNEKKIMEDYTASRIAGLLTLYLANDKGRIQDIVNRYYTNEATVKHIVPELEGYIEKKRSDEYK